jgi:hypothetical protein
MLISDLLTQILAYPNTSRQGWMKQSVWLRFARQDNVFSLQLYFVLQIFQSQARNLYGLLPGGRAAHNRDGAPGQAELVSQEDY